MADGNTYIQDLLTQFEANSGKFIDQNVRNYQRQIIQDALPTQAQLNATQPSASDLKRQEEAFKQQQTIEQNALNRVNRIMDKYGLSDQQKYLSTVSGDLPAAVDYELEQQLSKTNDNFEKQEEIRLARQFLEEDVNFFAQEQQANDPNFQIADYKAIPKERAKDLTTADSFTGFLSKAARSAVGGIAGLGAITTGAVGAEGVSQFLGEQAETIRENAPTDIGSEASKLEAARIQEQLASGQLTRSQAAAEFTSLLGDGDFFTDALSTLAGAAVGTKGLGALGRGAAQVAGGTAARTAGGTFRQGASQAGQRIDDAVDNSSLFARNAGAGTAASGVGLGAGVSGDITQDQSQLLLGTAIASGLTQGVLGPAADVALGRGASNLLSRTAPRVADDAATVGLGQAGANVVGRGLRTGGVEGITEGIESAGEAFGTSAQQNPDQGVLGTLANPEAQSQALDAAALGAPVGAVLGAPAGSLGSIAQDRAQNAQVAAREQVAAEEAQVTEDNNQLAADIAQGREQVQQANLDAQLQQARDEDAQLAARDSQIAALQDGFTNEVALTPEELANVPLRERGQNNTRQQRYTLEDLYNEADNPTGQLTELVALESEALSDSLRALYRNQVEVNPQGATLEGEDTFIDLLDVNRLQNVSGSDAQIAQEVREVLDNAFAGALDQDLVAQNIATQREQLQQGRDSAVAAQRRSVEGIDAQQQADDLQVASDIADQREVLQQGRASADVARGRTVEVIQQERTELDNQLAEAITQRREALAQGRQSSVEAQQSTIDSIETRQRALDEEVANAIADQRDQLQQGRASAESAQQRTIETIQQERNDLDNQLAEAIDQRRQALTEGRQSAVDAQQQTIDGIENRQRELDEEVANAIADQRESRASDSAASQNARVQSLDATNQGQNQVALANQVQDLAQQIRDGRLSAEQARIQTLDILGNTVSDGTRPITRETSSNFVENVGGKNLLTDQGRSVVAELRNKEGLKERDPSFTGNEINSILKATKTARSTLRRLNSKQDLTESEISEFESAKAAVEREIGKVKKPEAPVEGAGNTRQSRVATRTANPVSRPRSQGLLQETTEGQGSFFTPVDVQSTVNDLTKSFKGKVNVKVVATQADLPANLQNPDGVATAGLSDGNTAYIVADQIGSAAQAEAVLNEELFHRGILNSLGGDYNTVLDKVFKQRDVQGLLDLVGNNESFTTLYRDVISEAQSGNKDAQREVVDEVLARVSDSGNIPKNLQGLIGQVIAKIKQAIRKVRPEWLERYTDNDLYQLVRDANRAGRQAGTFNGPTQVRQSRVASEPGEILVGDELLSFNPDGTRSSRAADRTFQDRRNDTKNFIQTLWEDGGRAAADSVLTSKFYGKAVKGFADATQDLFLSQTFINRLPDGAFRTILEDIKTQEGERLDTAKRPMLTALIDGITTKNDEQNVFNIKSQLSRVASTALDLANRGLKVNGDSTVREVIQNLNDTVGAFAAAKNISLESADRQLSTYSTARHTQQRNDTMWLLEAPLETNTPTELKSQRTELSNKLRAGTITATEVQTLSDIINTHSKGDRESFVASGFTDAQAQALLDTVASDPDAALYEQYFKSVQRTISATNDVKRQNGSYSNSFDSTIKALGWDTYVPLKGKSVRDEELGENFISHFSNSDFNETFRPVKGRESLVDNITSQVTQDLVSAVNSVASRPLLEALAVHASAARTSDTYTKGLEKDGHDGRMLAAEVREMDINSGAYKKLVANKDPRIFILHDKDNDGKSEQKALVIRMDSQAGADAILGARSAAADSLENRMRSVTLFGKDIHWATSFMASLKTSRNLPFIPFDMLRNILTLAGLISTQQGYSGFKSYVGAMVNGGVSTPVDIARYVNLWRNNEFDQIDRIVKAEPNGAFAELDEFYRNGGPVSFLSALRDRDPSDLASIGGQPVTNKGKKILKGVDDFATKMNIMADTVSRFAYYKALKDSGISPEIAAGMTKDTANFEQRGTWSGPLSGAFEFFRATAVGNTALWNNILSGPYAAQTLGVAAGSGFTLYMMANMLAGKDEDDEDIMGKINGRAYENNFVAQIGDDRYQFGLGFGQIAAAASTGIQLARFMLGHNSGEQTLDNSVSAMVNQSKLVPTSGINPFENPAAFGVLTLTPSLLKPLAESTFNISSLGGLPVRSEYPGAESGAAGSSFDGRVGSQTEIYENATEWLRNNDIMDINPDDMKHITRTYFAGAAYLMEAAVENIKYATSDEDYAYDKKMGLWPFRQFVASNFDQRTENFYKHYNQVQGMIEKVEEAEKSANPDTLELAEAIKNSEFFQENFQLAKDAESALRDNRKVYRDIIRDSANDTRSNRTAIKREAERGVEGLRTIQDEIMKDYLERAF